MSESITKRIDQVTHIPDQYLVPAPPAPRSVKIELTGRCNYRCGFCALRMRDEQPGVRDDMDFALFQDITWQMREAGVQEIGVFYLGESLMAPELTIEAVRWLKNNLQFPYVFLTTNGSLCTEDVAYNLMSAGLDSLKFSINAYSMDQFGKVMGVKPKLYRKAIENLKMTWAVRCKHDFDTRLYASSILYDGEQQKLMKQIVTEIETFVDEHYWLPLYSMGSVATEREAELGYRPTAGNQGRVGAMVQPIPCWSAFTEGHVRADGTLSLCCFDADGRFVVGDLKTTPFMEAWNSPEFQRVRAAHLKGDVAGTVCSECIAYS